MFFRNNKKTFFIFVYLISISINTKISAATQSGGGYVITGLVDSAPAIISGNGYISNITTTPNSLRVDGNGYSTDVRGYVLPQNSSFSSSSVLLKNCLAGSFYNGNDCTNKLIDKEQVNKDLSILSCIEPIFFSKPIKYGVFANNDKNDVKLLEKFLNTYENAELPINGIYEKKDRDAVIAWQEKNFDTVLKPWGLKNGTGYVYTSSVHEMKSQVKNRCSKSVVDLSEADKSSQGMTCPVFNKNQRIGSAGQEVKKIQEFLNNDLGSNITADGLFGFETKLAVKAFQKKYQKTFFKITKIPVSGNWHENTIKQANYIKGCK